MTHHPFAQIARNGNPKSQEIRPLPPFPAKPITSLAAFRQAPQRSRDSSRTTFLSHPWGAVQGVSLFSLFFHEIYSERDLVLAEILDCGGLSQRKNSEIA